MFPSKTGEDVATGTQQRATLIFTNVENSISSEQMKCPVLQCIDWFRTDTPIPQHVGKSQIETPL